jgi:hypothetical protein
MGFLDDVVGKVKEAVGGGEHSALAKRSSGCCPVEARAVASRE